MAYYEAWQTWRKQCHKHSTFLWVFSPMIPSSNFDYSGGSTNSNGNKSSSKTTSSSENRPRNSKNYALFRLPLKAKDALGASMQVKMIFLVEVIVTQKTKTLIFHRVKIPAKQNTEAVLWRYSERKVFCTCIKFPGDRPCRFVISVKLPCNFIEIALLHGCFL